MLSLCGLTNNIDNNIDNIMIKGVLRWWKFVNSLSTIHMMSFFSSFIASSILTSIVGKVREGFTKKSSCSFGFCPNYLDPPLPLIWTTCTTFLNVNVPKKNGQGSPPSSPSPNWPIIQFVKSGQKSSYFFFVKLNTSPFAPLCWQNDLSSARVQHARAVTDRQSPTVGPGKDFQKKRTLGIFVILGQILAF